MTKAKKKPNEDFIRALETRASYKGRSNYCGDSLTCWVRSETPDAAIWKKLPKACGVATYVVSLGDEPIAWVAASGEIFYTNRTEAPTRQPWGWASVEKATWKKYIALCKKHLLDPSTLKAQEAEALASILASFGVKSAPVRHAPQPVVVDLAVPTVAPIVDLVEEVAIDAWVDEYRARAETAEQRAAALEERMAEMLAIMKEWVEAAA